MPKAEKKRDSIYTVQVVNRVFDILETISKEEGGMRLTELAGALELPFSTAHRLVSLMSERGYLEQDPESRLYSMGMKVVELRGQLLRRIRLTEQAAPVMRELVHETGELAHLAVLYDGEIVYLLSLEGPRTPMLYTPIGSRSPIHCTSLGKCFLAYLSKPEITELLKKRELKRYTARTIVTIKELMAELAEVRKCGYAVDNGEQYEELRCVGAPIFDHRGIPVAAMSVAAPAMRVPVEKLSVLGGQVRRAALSISARMGYQPTEEVASIR